MFSSDTQKSVIAVYRYEKTSNEDLQFEKGEHLTILQRLTDGNWALARNRKGQSGLVPLNFVEADMDPPWLHDNISRDEAELLLQNEAAGSFLVRASGRFHGDYTLSVVAPYSDQTDPDGKKELPVQHYHIYSVDALDGSSSSRFFSLDNKEIFPSLRKLVEHYKIADRGLVHPLTTPIVDTERLCMQYLRDHHWVPRGHLIFGQKLGHGEFGEVLKAKIGDRDVAVKRYKASAKRQLIHEACIMSELKHENLLALLGVTEEAGGTAVGDGLPAATLCLVTEFSPLGSLLSYLRSRGRALIRPATLLSFAKDVARGLAYMEACSYLHCDVAARNVLLFCPRTPHSPRPVAKLGDFGLAFRLPLAGSTHASEQCLISPKFASYPDGPTSVCPFLFTTGGQRMANITRIPIKWTAPESIRTRIFTHKSDVWSFGVLLWELYSYGRLPYPRLMTSQVLAHLEAGERMEAPQDCPAEVYGLMREAWAPEPADRPAFAHILQRLRAFTQADGSPLDEAVVVPPAIQSADNAYDTVWEEQVI